MKTTILLVSVIIAYPLWLIAWYLKELLKQFKNK